MTTRPPQFFLSHRQAFETRDEQKGSDDGSVYSSSDVFSFHSLVTHDGPQGRKEAPELMMQALAAVFLLRCLQFKGGEGKIVYNYVPLATMQFEWSQ